jgi:hypothetical protein
LPAARGFDEADQTPQLAELPGVPRPAALDEAPPLGPCSTLQTPIRGIAQLSGLHLNAGCPARSVPPGRGQLLVDQDGMGGSGLEALMTQVAGLIEFTALFR